MARNQEHFRSIRDKVRKKAQEVNSTLRYNGKMFVPKAGTYRMIILPYEVSQKQPEAGKGELWYRRMYYIHSNIGPEGDQKKYVCPSSIFQPCPICEDVQELKKDYDSNKGIIDSIKRKVRELYNIVLEEDFAKYLKGKVDLKDIIQLFEISNFCFGKHLEEEIRESEIEDNYAAFADFQGGSVLKVRFTEMDFGQSSKKKGKDVPVEVSRIDFEDREDLDEEEVLSAIIDLNTVLAIPSYDQLKKIYYEMEELEGEEKEDETPKKDRTSKREEPEPEPPKRKRRSEPDSEEESPRRGRKSEPEPDEDDLSKMDRDELLNIISDEELEVKVRRSMEEDDIRNLIREERVKKEEAENAVPPPERGRQSESEEDEIPKRGRKSEPEPEPPKRGKTSVKSSRECPVKKGKFGEDCGEFAECDDCNQFDTCIEAKEKM